MQTLRETRLRIKAVRDITLTLTLTSVYRSSETGEKRKLRAARVGYHRDNASGGGHLRGGGGGKLPRLNQQVHPPAVKPGRYRFLSGVFLTFSTKLLQNPLRQANMGISFDQNVSLCLKSDIKIVHFKVNFVFLQAKQQKHALSLTISLRELIVSDENSQIHD